MSKKHKVFCIGFQKTGTTSMEAALGELGYKVASIFGKELPLDELRRSYVARGLEIAEEYDAVQDMPWPLLYRELDQAFPGSKFILTWRDTDKWLNSVCGHLGTNGGVLQQLSYGEDARCPVGNEDLYRTVYETHNVDVRAYFRNRPDDFLEMKVADGDGWEPLCRFLNEPVPAVPFPFVNSAKARNSISRRLMKRLRNTYRSLRA